MRLSMPYLQRSCFSLGLRIAALIAALQASYTTASAIFTKEQQCLNAFPVYYLLALHICLNQDSHGTRWQEVTLSAQTIKNCCGLAAHCVTSAMTSIETSTAQEIAIERYFSNLKRPYRGTPSVRDCTQGTARAVLQQTRSLQGVTAEQLDAVPHQQRDPLTPEVIAKCSSKACATAIKFMSLICVDVTADEVVHKFTKWYDKKGSKFFGASSSHVPAEDMADELDFEQFVELDDDAVDEGVAHSCSNIVHAVQDRAAVREEVAELYKGLRGDAKESEIATANAGVNADAQDTQAMTQYTQTPSIPTYSNTSYRHPINI